MNASQQFVATMRDAERMFLKSFDSHYSYASFFTRHAVAMNKVGPLPDKARHGKMGECYHNSTHLAIDHGLIYCEGYAVSGHVPCLPLLHGWCLNPKTLEVIDPTWKDGRDYYGVAFTPSWVRKVALSTKYYGIIDNWRGGDDYRTGMLSGKIKTTLWKHPVMRKLKLQPQPQLETETNSAL